MTLRETIEAEIRERGPIPFSRYIDLCLYHPGLGYYSRNAEQFGKAGDFYTSSDVHAVFGRLLTRQFEEMWRVLDRPSQMEILELGPGRGLFAQDVLAWAEKKFPDFFQTLHYSLLEQSPTLRTRLEKNLGRSMELGKVSLLSAEESPALPRKFAPEVQLIIFANEFFDALPVEVVGAQGTLRISVEGGHFVESWARPSAAELDFLMRYSIHPQGAERVEALLLAQQWMSRAAATIQRGFLLAIDYGYTQQELLAGRHRGTVAAYRQHSVSASPYEAPGEQDITAHVNFTALSAAAELGGMTAQAIVTQSQFLLGIGEDNQFADAFEQCGPPQEKAKVALQLKHLVTPAGMGESFQVLAASKGVNADAVAALKGLSFGRTLQP